MFHTHRQSSSTGEKKMGNPKTKDTSNPGQQELHTAARSGDLAAVQLICSSDPLSVNSRDKHSRTPLHLAAWSGQAQVVEYLCKNKADVGASAMDDMGAIHFAAQKGHVEVVRTLISFGVSVKSLNRKGLTALHYAVQGSHVDLVKYLVKKGASLSAKNKAGKTPLDLASSDEIREFLLECETLSKQGHKNGKLNVEEAQSKAMSRERADPSDGEVAAAAVTEDKKDELTKRKGAEDGEMEKVTEPKRAKVALNHLSASDDAQDEEENC